MGFVSVENRHHPVTTNSLLQLGRHATLMFFCVGKHNALQCRSTAQLPMYACQANRVLWMLTGVLPVQQGEWVVHLRTSWPATG